MSVAFIFCLMGFSRFGALRGGTVGFPYHPNSHKKKIPGQIVDMTNNLLLDEL